MRQFIRLTDSERDNIPVWVNVDHIVHLWPVPGDTAMVCCTGDYDNICAGESVERILAMIADAEQRR